MDFVRGARWAAAVGVLCGLSAGLGLAQEREPFQFGLWGDMPYTRNGDGAKDGPRMRALIDDMNAAKLAFTVYDGDTKDGSSVCDDVAIGADAIKMFNQLAAPTVYVLGDNEWTDCHRKNNGGYDALERLAFLRKTMFGEPASFGQRRMMLEQQGAPGQPYSENTRWELNGVVFVGLNVPGSNNNKVNDGQCLSAGSARTAEHCAADNAEYAERNAQNLAWLAQSFERGRDLRAAGLMAIIQADPGFDLPETVNANERTTSKNIDGYTDLLDTLARESRNFAGQVVLVHGDTHYFKIDKPLIGPVAESPAPGKTNMIANFTRVETFGSPNLHWLRVTADPRSRSVFIFEPMIVAGN